MPAKIYLGLYNAINGIVFKNSNNRGNNGSTEYYYQK